MTTYNDDILNEWAERSKRKWIEKQKAKRTNFVSGENKSTGASCTNGGAKVQINSGTAKQNLRKVAEKYKNTNNPHGFLTDLSIALGIPLKKRS